jgi:ATP-dependent Clp protease adaptor protein ClpS
MIFASTSPKYNPQEDLETLIESGWVIVLYNDEVNSFEYVTITLIEVCEHSQEQAEQCTLQIHFRGKCIVKNGEFDELVKMRNEICRRGISAEKRAGHLKEAPPDLPNWGGERINKCFGLII